MAEERVQKLRILVQYGSSLMRYLRRPICPPPPPFEARKLEAFRVSSKRRRRQLEE
jgi:hypothetical protein